MADEDKTVEQPQSVDLDGLASKILENISGALDKRFQGFQSLLDRRDSEYRQMLEDSQNANLSPEEREEAQAQALRQERDGYKRRLELLELRKNYPDEVDLLDGLLQGKSLQEQLDLLSTFRKATESTESPPVEQAEGDEENVQPTPVDRNNPKRRATPNISDAGGTMNAELADKVLNDADQPGALSRLRKALGG